MLHLSLRRTALIGATALAASFAAPAASAAPTWLPATTHGDVGNTTVFPHVATAPDGTTVSIWNEQVPYVTSRVLASVREPGGTWSTPDDLDPGIEATDPAVGIAANGAATAVWVETRLVLGIYDHRVVASTRPPGGSWSAPTQLSPAGETWLTDPDVAVDSMGNAVAIWKHQEQGAPDTQTEIVTAVRRGGIWGPPASLTGQVQAAGPPSVAISRSGDATAIWIHTTGAVTRVASAELPAGGAWSTPVDVSESNVSSDSAQVALDAAGNATLVWRSWRSPYHEIETSTRPARGAWTTPSKISDSFGNSIAPDVAVDAAGNATAAWQRSIEPQQLVVADRSAGGAWSTPVDFTPGDARDGFDLDVAKNPKGDTAITWRHAVVNFDNSDKEHEEAIFRPAGGAWQPRSVLFAPDAETFFGSIAIDDAGDVVATWTRHSDTTTASGRPFLTQTRTLDVAGPAFTAPGSLSVPAAGAVGVPVQLAASAVDTWSTVSGPVAWQTGDGGTASGSTATHTYAKPGTFTVTASATDSLGNVGTATRTITITGASTSPATVIGASGGGNTGATPAFTVRGKLATFTKALLTKSPGAKRCPKPGALTITIKAGGRAVVIGRRKLTIAKTSRGCLLSGTATLKKAVKPKVAVGAKVRGTGLKGRTLRTVAG